MSIGETKPKAAAYLGGENFSTDDRVLVAQAKCGCSSAFGELYERHQSKIYHCAFRILRNRQDAEDAVQRAFQRALTNLHRFREDSAFLTWMTRIAINGALMLLRRRRITTALCETHDDNVKVISTLDSADDRPNPEQALVENELRATVTHAISRLNKSLRTLSSFANCKAHECRNG